MEPAEDKNSQGIPTPPPSREELRAAAEQGLPVHRGSGESVEQGEQWGPERTLPADLVQELLVGADAAQLRALILVGLRISGRLNLEAVEWHVPLITHGCYFDQPLNFTAAMGGEVRILKCRLPGIAADRLDTRGDLDLSGSTLDVLGLADAHIGGSLRLTEVVLNGGTHPLDVGDGWLLPEETALGSYIRPETQVAFMGDSLIVEGSLQSFGLRAQGDVSLAGARVGGWLVFDGVTFGGELRADLLSVAYGMHFRLSSVGGEISLTSAHIAGSLSFDGTTLAGGLIATGVQVDDGLSLREGFRSKGEIILAVAKIARGLYLDGAFEQGLAGSTLHVDGEVRCGTSFHAGGKVVLVGAAITGELSFERPSILEEGLNAARLQVGSAMHCGSISRAVVDMRGASIGSDLTFTGATLEKGLDADALRVEGSFWLYPEFRAERTVRLLGARVKGSVVLDGALFSGGLNARYLHVDGDIKCRNLTVIGDFELGSAYISGDLSFDGATVSRRDSRLSLDGARILGRVSLRFAERPAGVLDLSGARMGALYDAESTWPERLMVAGCIYDDIRAEEDETPTVKARRPVRARESNLASGWTSAPHDVRRRLRWIQRAEVGHAIERSEEQDNLSPAQSGLLAGTRYRPQPYAQLMSVYRQVGRDADARRVGYARERARRQSARLPGKTWNWFLERTVGYGYKPLRAVLLLATLVAVGSPIFSSFHRHGHLKPAGSEHSAFVAPIYTLDRLVPVVSFGQRDAFVASGAARWWAFAYTLVGWAVTIAVVAGLNAAVRRE